MIPFKAVLVLYIPFSILLMADRNSARGFSLAVLGSLLFLPAGESLQIPKIPDLDKYVVCVFGALIGTAIFHSQQLLRFRPRWYDGLLVLMMMAGVATSIKNGLGAYDGFSLAFKTILNFILLLYLARIHLGTPKGLRMFLLLLVGASVIYAPLALWEWRMSPQIHRTLYGYFQHDFAQFRRMGFFRPVVCFPHALALGRFYAFCAFLAAFPLRNELKRVVPFGDFVFLIPLFGLMLSMSLGPVIMFLVLTGLYFSVARWNWTGYVLPVGAVCWAILLFLGLRPLYGAVDVVESISPDRAQSLQYRLRALDVYRENILESPIWGHGRFGRGRISKIATDSFLLVRSLSEGLLGAALLFGWWLCAMHTGLRLAHETRGSPFQALALGVAVLTPVCFAISMVDSALDFHVQILASALIGTEGLVHAMRSTGRKFRLVRRAGSAASSVPLRPARTPRIR